MSGGSYDYAFERIERYASDLRNLAVDILNREVTRERIHFCSCLMVLAENLQQLSEPLHAIEWDDSGDTIDSAKDVLQKFLDELKKGRKRK